MQLSTFGDKSIMLLFNKIKNLELKRKDHDVWRLRSGAGVLFHINSKKMHSDLLRGAVQPHTHKNAPWTTGVLYHL